MKNKLATILILAWLPILAFAREAKNPWDELYNLRGGSRIEVEEVNRAEVQGTLLGVTEDRISLWVKDRQQDIARGDVRRVKAQGQGFWSRVGVAALMVDFGVFSLAAASRNSETKANSQQAGEELTRGVKALAAAPAAMLEHPQYEIANPKPEAPPAGAAKANVKKKPGSAEKPPKSKNSVPSEPKDRN